MIQMIVIGEDKKIKTFYEQRFNQKEKEFLSEKSHREIALGF